MLDVRDEMKRQGFECDDEIVMDGEIHRYHIPGDKHGKKNGWYVFFRRGDKVFGVFGDWKAGARGTIGGKSAEIQQVMQKKKVRDEARSVMAAKRAQSEWDAAAGCWTTRDANPYLVRKRVAAYGVRRSGQALLVPMYREGAIVGLQRIEGDGTKRFTPGMKKLGSSFLIGKPGPTLIVAEGYATGASLHKATGLPVLVTFDCGNILPAVRAYVGKVKQWIFAADNDANTAGNPGVTKSTAAALEVGGVVVVPTIVGDFNDLHIEEGLGAVASIVYAAL